MSTINIVESGNLTDHFKLSEFYCNTDSEILISHDFIYIFIPMLEKFRCWYNRPININSGYRTKKVNSACGGSSNSSHLLALAVDFNYPSEYYNWADTRKQQFLTNVKNKWIELAHEKNFYAQVNFYNNRFHLGLSYKKDNFLDYR